jgi:hypothetical protein
VLYQGQELAKVMMYQIYYKHEQRGLIYPFATPYFNEGLTIFFENEVIRKLVSETTAEKIAVCSWKLREKVRRIHPITEEALNRDFQVLSFTRNSQRHQMMAMSAVWHKDFIPAIDLLWTKLGLKRPGEAKQPIYQNHFCSTSEIYKRYVAEFLSPAMDLISTDEELHEIMLRPSWYGRLARGSDVKSVKAKLGLTDYPLCPFVLERCPSLWFTMKRINVTYL